MELPDEYMHAYEAWQAAERHYKALIQKLNKRQLVAHDELVTASLDLVNTTKKMMQASRPFVPWPRQ